MFNDRDEEQHRFSKKRHIMHPETITSCVCKRKYQNPIRDTLFEQNK